MSIVEGDQAIMAPWPFERGKLYNRRDAIHARYGGQRQGGIITPKSAPAIILITGGAGKQHGYSDHLRDDGGFDFFGEGQLGDMQMRAGNLAIAGHSGSGKSILLFEKQKDGLLRFDGEWTCSSVREERAPDTSGTMRRAYIFELKMLDVVEQEGDEQHIPYRAPLDEMRKQAIDAASLVLPGQDASRTVYQRSRAVRSYVLARAGHNCEGCDAMAPFVRDDGSPYLEPHHIRRVSDGGPDDPRWVIALCPNCHRRAHHSRDRAAFSRDLLTRLRAVEPV